MEVVRRLTAYNAAESCSKCTPCREGTKRMLDLLGAVQRGEEGRLGLEKLAYLNDVVGFGSCAVSGRWPRGLLGQGWRISRMHLRRRWGWGGVEIKWKRGHPYLL